MKYSGYFTLYPICVLTKGKVRASIGDLQRNDVFRIPMSLAALFDDDGAICIDEVYTGCEGPEDVAVLEEYLDFLKENDLGVFTADRRTSFRKIAGGFDSPRLISNCIIDFTADSRHPLRFISEQLDRLGCEALEMRYFDPVPAAKIKKDLRYFAEGELRSVRVLLIGEADEEANDRLILGLLEANHRITEIVFHSASRDDSNVFGNMLTIIYTTQPVRDETCCGQVSPEYLVAQTQLYIESQHVNNCLFQKIAIDKTGAVKNCPSMRESFGEIARKPDLEKIVRSERFRRLWQVNKDRIDVCRDCELRYVCQDCRAYVADPADEYSKPAKCQYDPLS